MIFLLFYTPHPIDRWISFGLLQRHIFFFHCRRSPLNQSPVRLGLFFSGLLDWFAAFGYEKLKGSRPSKMVKLRGSKSCCKHIKPCSKMVGSEEIQVVLQDEKPASVLSSLLIS